MMGRLKSMVLSLISSFAIVSHPRSCTISQLYRLAFNELLNTGSVVPQFNQAALPVGFKRSLIARPLACPPLLHHLQHRGRRLAPR